MMTTSHAFYTTFAPWWPLVSPVEEYREEAAFAASLLKQAAPQARTVLELGSGGGHNAFHLRQHFEMTLVDLSDAMLDVSRGLNPGVPHLQGDMRTVRLGRTFDAVFIHDAVDYMASQTDLQAALKTAFEHCRPGGAAVIIPDTTRENWEAGTDSGGSDGEDGRGIRFLEWSWDPNPADDWTQTEYNFLLRAPDGSFTSFHETHRTGLFSEQTWLALLADAGFTPTRITEVTTEDRTPRTCFIGRKA